MGELLLMQCIKCMECDWKDICLQIARQFLRTLKVVWENDFFYRLTACGAENFCGPD